MNRRLLFLISFVYCFLLCAGGCSFVRSKKPVDEAKNPAAAEASNIEWKERTWENYAEDKGGVQFYFEKESLTYPSKDLIRVWRKRVFPGKSSNQKEIVSLDEINCETEKYRTLELQGVNWDDTKTVIYRRPTPWTTIYADSPDDYFLAEFCRRGSQ